MEDAEVFVEGGGGVGFGVVGGCGFADGDDAAGFDEDFAVGEGAVAFGGEDADAAEEQAAGGGRDGEGVAEADLFRFREFGGGVGSGRGGGRR